MERNIRMLDAFELELAEASGQRTEAWRDIRAGKFTASEIYKLMGEPRSKAAKDAGEWGDEATTYINTKVAEHMTGQVHPSATANSLEWGTDMEPVAKEHFTIVTGKIVEFAGFKIYNQHAGGSSDGHVGDFLIEIKCPFNSGTHVEYLKLKKGIEIQFEYPKIWWQIQSNLLFNDKAMSYFAAFDPRFPEKQKMKILEVYADKDSQEKILLRLNKAIDAKLKLIEQLT
jgi:hypothetical protein